MKNIMKMIVSLFVLVAVSSLLNSQLFAAPRCVANTCGDGQVPSIAGPRGARGPTGPAGVAGPPGPAGAVTTSGPSPLLYTRTVAVTSARCGSPASTGAGYNSLERCTAPAGARLDDLAGICDVGDVTITPITVLTDPSGSRHSSFARSIGTGTSYDGLFGDWYQAFRLNSSGGYEACSAVSGDGDSAASFSSCTLKIVTTCVRAGGE